MSVFLTPVARNGRESGREFNSLGFPTLGQAKSCSVLSRVMLGLRFFASDGKIVCRRYCPILVCSSKRAAGIEQKRASAIFSVNDRRCGEHKSGSLVPLRFILFTAGRNDGITQSITARQSLRQIGIEQSR